MNPTTADTGQLTKLKSERVQLALRRLPRWQATDAAPRAAELAAQFVFESRPQALSFLGLASEVAERNGVEFEAAIAPAWYVLFRTKAKESEALSEREVEIAEDIEQLFNNAQPY